MSLDRPPSCAVDAVDEDDCPAFLDPYLRWGNNASGGGEMRQKQLTELRSLYVRPWPGHRIVQRALAWTPYRVGPQLVKFADSRVGDVSPNLSRASFTPPDRTLLAIALWSDSKDQNINRSTDPAIGTWLDKADNGASAQPPARLPFVLQTFGVAR